MNHPFDRSENPMMEEDVSTILASELLADLKGAYTSGNNLPSHKQLEGWIEEFSYETVSALTKEVVSSGTLNSPGGFMNNRLKAGWEPVEIPQRKRDSKPSLWLTNLFDYIKEKGEVEVYASPIDDELLDEPEIVLTEDDISYLMSHGPSSHDDPCSHWTEEVRNRVFWILCMGTRLCSTHGTAVEVEVSKKFEAFKSMYDFYMNKYNPDIYERIIKVRKYMQDQIDQGIPAKEAFTSRYGALGQEVEL